MSPAADGLQKGDSLPDGDEISRYCTPLNFNPSKNQPSHLAFMRRAGEDNPSVNHLGFFSDLNREEAVKRIRSEVGNGYTIRPTGRFVVFNVGQAKDAAKEVDHAIDVIYDPYFPDKPSHSLIMGMPEDVDAETQVATAIQRLITNDDIYPGKL